MPRRTNVKHAGTLQVRVQGPGDGGWTQDTVWNAPEASELNDVTSTLHTLSKDLGESSLGFLEAILCFSAQNSNQICGEERDFSQREKQRELYSDPFSMSPTYPSRTPKETILSIKPFYMIPAYTDKRFLLKFFQIPFLR